MDRRTRLRIFFLTLFVLICFLQCFSIVKSFLEYPTIINTYDESPSLISILPAITICNNNRVSLKQLMKNNATLRQVMERRFGGNQLRNGKIIDLVDRLNFDDFRDELFRLFKRLNFKPDKMVLNLTLDGSFDYKPNFDSFIEWFSCSRTSRHSMDCANLTRIESVNLRKCSTLLHQGAMLYDGSNRPELFSGSTPKPTLGMKDYFDSKEVAKLVINFEPEDYGDLSRQIGGRITFHDSSFVAGVGDFDFFITRGFRYDFSIDRLDTKIKPHPYSNCLDYQRRNLHKYRTQVEPRIPLNAHTCFQNCLVKNVLSRSECWPATQPYFRNDSFDPDLKVKFCPWFRTSHQDYSRELVRVKEVRKRIRTLNGNGLNQTIGPRPHLPRHELENLFEEALAAGNLPNATRSAHSREYRKINRFCLSKCALPCRIVQYSVTVTKSVWPSDVKVLFDKTGEMRYKRHCCALVLLKYAHFHYNIHEYQPKYDLTNIVGDLGGLLAFWLGLSIISIYHAIQKLIGLCSRRSLNKIRDLRGMAQ